MSIRFWIGIVVAVVVAALQVLKLYLRERSLWARRLQATVIILALVAFIVAELPHHDPFAQQIGILTPKDVKRRTEVQPNSYMFEASTGLIYVNLPVGTTIQPISQIPFCLTTTNGGILVSMVLYDLEGKVVGEIRNNEWVLNPNNYFRKNFDSSAIEVISPQNLPILQVEYLNRNTIRVGGLFRTERSSISELYPDFPTPTGEWGQKQVIKMPSQERFLIIGANGLRLFPPDPTEAQRRDIIAHAQRDLRRWFDYAHPTVMGLRATTTLNGELPNN